MQTVQGLGSMTKKLGMTDELIADRRIEEILENLRDANRLGASDARFHLVAPHAYAGMAKLWGLSRSDAGGLLGLSSTEYVEWQNGAHGCLGEEHIRKVFCLIKMFKELDALYSRNLDRVCAWMCRENGGRPFEGNTPYNYFVRSNIDEYLSACRHLAAATT